MKKILMASVLLSLASLSTFGAQMISSCSNSPLSIAPSGNTANGNLTCAAFSLLPAGSTITGYTFQYGVDFTVDQFNAANPSITFSFNNPGTALDVTNITSTVGSTGIVTVGPVATTGSDASYFSPITSAFTSTTTSNITNVTVNGRFLLDYNLPQSGVPEPSTVALIGAGLVGVASIARRRRS